MMESNHAANSNSSATTDPATGDLKLEVIVIPVADIDRAREFYVSIGWRLDVTPPFVVQLTPPGSGCSVQFGTNWTTAAPGSAKAYLIVADVVATRDTLVAAGAETVIAGCTEVPLLLAAEDVTVPLVDSAEVLAQACVNRCK